MDDSVSYMDIVNATGDHRTFDNPMYNIDDLDEQDKSKQAEAAMNNNQDSPALLGTVFFEL